MTLKHLTGWITAVDDQILVRVVVSDEAGLGKLLRGAHDALQEENFTNRHVVGQQTGLNHLLGAILGAAVRVTEQGVLVCDFQLDAARRRWPSTGM